MKEIYDWVPWFEELGKKIAEGGEQYLANNAKMVAWKDDDTESALLKYGESNIDPMSFFYTLASQSKNNKSRNRIYPSITKIFGMPSTLDVNSDEMFKFPTPPGVNSLFHKNGNGNPSLLWRLFRDAVQGFDAVQPEDFENALKIPHVATQKLTQVLFLINPKEFIPIDDRTKSLGLFDRIPNSIIWEEYRKRIDQIRDELPGCQLFEANLISYLQTVGTLGVQTNRCFQVSTNVQNDRVDYWDDFESNNWVYTGGAGTSIPYPLDEPNSGDVVLVRFGRTEGRGIGVVYRNDYIGEFEEDQRLHVLWLNKENAPLSGQTPVIGMSRAGTTTVDAFRQSSEYATTFELLYRLENRDDTITEWPRNQIIYGPPGTGKTWRTTALAQAIIYGVTERQEPDLERFHELRFDPDHGTGQVAMITFHQNFAYEDFVEGIRPVLQSGGSLTYELRSGIFKRFAEAAQDRQNEKFVLIIDEINRGNIAKIFGELITLIEDSRRIGQVDQTYVTLPYSGATFGVPDNLYIIGTMNTADRSIQLLDTALRRRFTFIEMMPDPEQEGVCRDIDGIDCTKMLKSMNERIATLLDREHQIGHTYLLGVNNKVKLSEAFRKRIFPLLQEYFFDDWSKIRAILGRNAFVTRREIRNLSLESDLGDETRYVYERLPDSDSAWEDSDQYHKICGSDIADEPEES